jgi:thermitase
VNKDKVKREMRDLMSNRLIVQFHSNVTKSQCMKIHKQMGATMVNCIDELNCHVVSTENDMEKCRRGYSCCKEVEFIEKDIGVKIDPIKGNAIPNDPGFTQQWGLLKVLAPNAWSISKKTPPRISIAILDTGIDQNHEDLHAKLILNQNFTDSDTADDLNGHGTHVAGIAGAMTNNALGVAGMSYNAASLMNIKVLGDDGFGLVSWVAQGIVYAANQGAKVINLSLSSSTHSKLLRRAILYAWRDKRVVIVAAAGNDSTNTREFPAAYNPVISVAATNKNDRKAGFSNYGSRWVDVAAPGVKILSTTPNHPHEISCLNYCTLSGTSMSTPFVSGLAALIYATNPKLNHRQVVRIIQEGAVSVPGTGRLYEHGRIDAHKSIVMARQRSNQ